MMEKKDNESILPKLPKFVNPIDKIMKVVRSETVERNSALINAEDDNVDLKTDLEYPEDILICSLDFDDDFLMDCGLEPMYKDFTLNLQRKRFSLDRGSRREFVEVNKKDTLTDDLTKIGSVSNLQDVRR